MIEGYRDVICLLDFLLIVIVSKCRSKRKVPGIIIQVGHFPWAGRKHPGGFLITGREKRFVIIQLLTLMALYRLWLPIHLQLCSEWVKPAFSTSFNVLIAHVWYEICVLGLGINVWNSFGLMKISLFRYMLPFLSLWRRNHELLYILGLSYVLYTTK